MEEETVSGKIEVWEHQDGWWTSFPPPSGFDGEENGQPGDHGYSRRLSRAEQAVVDRDEAEERAEEVAVACARRDRHFGFGGGVSGTVLALFEKVQPLEPLDGDEESEPVPDPGDGAEG